MSGSSGMESRVHGVSGILQLCIHLWTKKAPKREDSLRGLSFTLENGCLVHAVHAAATMLMSAAARFLLLGDVGDHGFGGEHQAGD